jgi:hypothetical protein
MIVCRTLAKSNGVIDEYEEFTNFITLMDHLGNTVKTDYITQITEWYLKAKEAQKNGQFIVLTISEGAWLEVWSLA